MRNEKISEKVENGGKKNKIANLFYSMKHAHFIWTPLKIEIALRKTVECFLFHFVVLFIYKVFRVIYPKVYLSIYIASLRKMQIKVQR